MGAGNTDGKEKFTASYEELSLSLKTNMILVVNFPRNSQLFLLGHASNRTEVISNGHHL